MINWNVRGDRVLIKSDTAETKTKKGIILPESSQETPPTGEVIAVGPGYDNPIDDIAVGDTVMYGENSGSTVVLNGEEYLLMRELEISMIEDEIRN